VNASPCAASIMNTFKHSVGEGGCCLFANLQWLHRWSENRTGGLSD
jgi:hypothetical protein